MLMGEHAVLRGQPAIVCAINKRMKLIGSGADRADVVAVLRRNHPKSFGPTSGILGRWIAALQANLMMAATPFTLTQALFGMGVLFFGLLAIVSMAVFSSSFCIPVAAYMASNGTRASTGASMPSVRLSQ